MIQQRQLDRQKKIEKEKEKGYVFFEFKTFIQKLRYNTTQHRKKSLEILLGEQEESESENEEMIINQKPNTKQRCSDIINT